MVTPLNTILFKYPTVAHGVEPGHHHQGNPVIRPDNRLFRVDAFGEDPLKDTVRHFQCCSGKPQAVIGKRWTLTFAWVSMTPLLTPVVPPVYARWARSSLGLMAT